MSEMGPGAADIAEVVSEVRERLPGLPEPPALEPEQARFRLFDSITTFLKNVAKRQPIVLVLDDLHWADTPSLLLLQFMAREIRSARLAVVGTYRDVELGRQHPLSQTLGELNREQLSQRVLLRGLTENDVARFIELTAGITPPEALVSAVFKETEGLPLFVNEIVRLLVAEGRLERPEEVESWSVTIPQGVREVIGRRLDRLSEQANELLTIASVLGREFSLDALERVGDLSGDRLLGVLEESVAARVIEELQGEVSRFSFSHAMIQETLYEELSATRRVRLHQQIGDELEAMYSDQADEHAAELAYHYGRAAAVGGPEKLVHYASAAGQRAAKQHAHEEAISHFRAALSAKEGEELDDETADLLVRLGRGLRATLQLRDAWRAYRQAFNYYVEAGKLDPVVAVAEAVGSTTDFLAITQAQLIERALSMTEEGSPEMGRLQVCLGYSVGMLGDYERAKDAFAKARAIVEHGDDQAALLRMLGFEAQVDQFHGRPREALEKFERAIELSQALDEPAAGTFGHLMMTGLSQTLGDIAGAIEHSRRYAELAQQTRDVGALSSGAYSAGARAFAAGDWEAAARELERGLEIAPRDPRHLATALWLELERGNFGASTSYLSRLLEIADQPQSAGEALAHPMIAEFLPYVQLVSGEPQDLDRAEQAVTFVLNAPTHATPLILQEVHAAAALLAILKEDHSRARDEYEYFQQLQGTFPLATHQADHLLGRLALTLGNTDEAIAHFESALAFLRRGYRPANAWAAYDCATAVFQRGAGDDRERAMQLLDESMAIVQELGMRPLMERVLALKMELQGLSATDIETSIDAVAATVQADQPDLRSHAAPDGTVTLLFTDIVDSTPLNERLGDRRWMELLREHNDLVREQVQAHEGYEVKTEGDGFMLAFSSARKGIDCAIAVQRAFAERNESAEEPLLVRSGLHTGEAIQDQGDFYGKHVTLAARIASQATGGQILTSSLLKELTDSAGDIEFDGGTEVELKGLTGTQRVFAIGW